jgi:uncharacterized membrane protein
MPLRLGEKRQTLWRRLNRDSRILSDRRQTIEIAITREEIMSELVVVSFDNPHDADRALTELGRLQREHLIDLADSVVAIRDPDGKLKLKQSLNLTTMGAASGALWGGMFGTLVGLVFLNPLLGLVSGAALGAGSGALSGKLADYGINDDFIRSVGQTLRPNTSALFVLVRKVQPEKVLAELAGFKGRVIRSSLSPDQERRLQEALSRSGASLPGSVPPPTEAAA